MTHLRRLLDHLSFPILIVICLTLGLAPFTPEPHIWEKLKLLAAGGLTQAIDIFDLLLHGLPWLLLIAKVALMRKTA
jgi:hypothetical protein